MRTDIDAALLQQAARVLGTTTERDTVDTALAAVVTAARRRAAVEAEAHRLTTGHYAPLAAPAAAGTGRR